MKHKIELHYFTNSTINAPSVEIISKSFASFKSIFNDDILITIWCDPNPNTNKFFEYLKNLRKHFSNVRICSSLSDGYVSAIKESKTEFLFMVEHDWIFNDNINHSLTDILYHMEEEKLWYLRFNQRRNEIKNSDKDLKQKNHENFYYCLTKNISNNPHIINRKTYIKKALPKIIVSRGSLGIEEHLMNKDLEGAIYGHLFYDATISHLDGRKHMVDNKEQLISKLMSKVKNTQMTEEEYRYIASFLGSINLLIFGTGHDSELWRHCNLNGNTVFLEHDPAWINSKLNDIYQIEYTTDISQYQQLLDEYKKGNDFSLKMNIPKHLKKMKWDVILVDSPPGWKTGTPGRMQSIYAAYCLANKETDIFIHDCDRVIENLYSDFFFSKLKNQLTKLKHMSL